MIKVITYGTYDLLHYGHIRLLERAKALGDYLIVGVTADDFDKTRGKINVQQSLMERIEAVRATGLADKIIVEEYEGQKIDDIRRYGVDIFTVGSDWDGKFDYLNAYCQVVYLDRTQGVSSSELRAEQRKIRLGLMGAEHIVSKYLRECSYVNGVEVSGIYTEGVESTSSISDQEIMVVDHYTKLFDISDAIYIVSHPSEHYHHVKEALNRGLHVLCESPIALSRDECKELFDLAKKKELILMESIKTAYSTAYNRLLVLVQSGKIGKVLSVDATCTSLRNIDSSKADSYLNAWNSICAWGPTAMLPVLQILGTGYLDETITSFFIDEKNCFDAFSKIDFVYQDAVASVKVGKGAKSEGDLVITGTKGYIYVPAPWWKTDYFELRYENQEQNRRYFYQLDGEGIRYEIVDFIKSIEKGKAGTYIDCQVTESIVGIIEKFYRKKGLKVVSYEVPVTG